LSAGRFYHAKGQALYNHPGPPSLDPAGFLKLVLVRRLKNLVVGRRLVEHCALRRDLLFFLDYEVNTSKSGAGSFNTAIRAGVVGAPWETILAPAFYQSISGNRISVTTPI
jgi:hypothetical protein